jgi:hypothetical protein
MQQLEIKFFWPLTEQIPLDLDYSDCHRGVSMTVLNGPCNFITVGSNISITSTFQVKAENIVFPDLPMPWYRKIMFKLLGFNWK